MNGYTHSEWIRLPLNLCLTGEGHVAAHAPGFDIDSLDAPYHIPAGGMHCRESIHLYWLRFGWPMLASRS